MAILPIYIYSDWKCTAQGQAIVPGVAGATGWAANPANWTARTPSEFSEDQILYTNARTIENNGGALTLSGGDALYNNAVSQSIPWYNTVNSDTELNGSSNPVYNPFFTSFDAENNIAYWLSIAAFDPQNEKPNQYVLRFGYYNQEPENATGTGRTSWRYWKYNINAYGELFYPGGNPTYFSAEFSQVKVYKLALGEKDYYLFAFGVSADNRYNVQQSVSMGTDFIAIPISFFKDKESRPWAGGDSESNAEEAYTPTEKYNDDIPPRDLIGKTNPYGFNGGNGLRLAVITYNQYAEILQGIYSGTAEGLLNKVAQQFYSITGGNDHRQADEIQSIVSAVLCCHLIPRIVAYGSGTAGMQTIAGYHIFGQSSGGGVSMEIVITSGTIFEYNTPLQQITPRLNSFLDFEPYTSITLHLPFMASVNLVPSAVYGNYLFVHYSIDIYTGVLSADVIIHEPGGREYIVTTQQANIKTEIPIMGNGANGAPLANIASSVLGVARSGSFETAAAAGAITAVDELSKASTGVAVGKNTIEGIGAYLSPRSAHLIITRPNPANPASNGKAGFLEMEGGTAHLSGNVGDFTGYSEFAEVRLDGFAATDAEKAEIERILKGGVYI